jgi:glyoxylase-like metal-dependent hydrolase (beta-lactamase superfamily II)
MEILHGVHQVDGVNGNAYVVTSGEQLIVVDTGMPKSARKILDCVSSMGRQSSSVSKILLTHCHIDHVGSAYELRELTGAKVAIHQEDADFLAGKRKLPSPGGVTGSLFKAFSHFIKSTPVQPDMILKENDDVSGLTVVHTPGHTPGSISLFDAGRRLLFVGDTLRFSDGRVSGPPERFTLDREQATQSIRKISRLDFDVMLSGHGEPLKPNASDRVRNAPFSSPAISSRKNQFRQFVDFVRAGH